MGASLGSKCSDVSFDKSGASKPLDASSSEEEEEDEEDDDEDEEEDDGDDMKTEAELALQEGPKRGKTCTFREVIDHANKIGLEEEKIKTAEAMLEQHKATRRREAYEAELRDFLDSDDSNDLVACQAKEKQGQNYGVTDKVLKPLRERILELEMSKDLGADEVEQAKAFLEKCSRRFVGSCAKGREAVWIDINTAKKRKALLFIDLTLKNFKVQTSKGDESSTCKVADVTAKKGYDVEEVVESKVFGTLSEADKENTVAFTGFTDGPWVFIEANKAKQDETMCAMIILNGIGLSDERPKSPKSPKRGQKASTKMAFNRSASNQPEDKQEDDDEEFKPVSPRNNQKDRSATRKSTTKKPAENDEEGGNKESKKDKKSKDGKKKKAKEEED